MGVRIRLARFGRRNLPFYRIFVADSRCPRDGRHLEVVGHYDPLPGAWRATLGGLSGRCVVSLETETLSSKRA
jgi:ribosomal protein S16